MRRLYGMKINISKVAYDRGLFWLLVIVVCNIGAFVLLSSEPEHHGMPIQRRSVSEPISWRDIVHMDHAPLERPKTEKFHRAGVVVENPECSSIGNNILRVNGGSAVDATVAVMLCAGVLSPHYSGIGGGFIMTVYDIPRGGNNREIRTMNARGVAARKANVTMFANTSHRRGGLAVMLPGEVAGLYAAWQRYGRLPWSYLVQPAIQLARASKVSRLLHKYIESSKEHFNKTLLTDLFLDERGVALAEGAVLHMPRLAHTLERIAAEGGDTFYRGSLATDIIDDLEEYDSILTLDDLKNYRPVWKKPEKVFIKSCNCTVYGPPPPASGIIAQFILKTLDGWVNKDTDIDVLYHRLIEVFKFAYAKRSYICDEDFRDLRQFKRDLLSDAFVAEVRSKISDSRTFSTEYYSPAYHVPTDHGTTHIAAFSAEGGAVSVTTSINLHFGANVLGRRTGIIFNDNMDDFSSPDFQNTYGFPSSEVNYIAPGKTPMSSMSPLIAVDSAGAVRMLAGAAGGSRIVSAVSQSFLNRLILEKEPDDSIGFPRLHHQLTPNVVNYEKGFPETVLSGLRARGHTVKLAEPERWFGGVTAVMNACDLPCRGDDGGDALRWRPRTCELFCLHVIRDRRCGEDAKAEDAPVVYY